MKWRSSDGEAEDRYVVCVVGRVKTKVRAGEGNLGFGRGGGPVKLARRSTTSLEFN